MQIRRYGFRILVHGEVKGGQMQLDYEKFQPVIDDLESRGAAVTILADVSEGRREIDYTIEACFNPRTWEIVEIQ